ncbi:glycosyltransferase family 25 protein [Hymenobacter sp. ISL-91]|uniref:glycosyltransferase family 25 protein n=1 Tax=Hymenobacter sp. ISL-91 TaxID=2819151 RepID=UPI001BE5AF60|nr:glycosyltransferase family 25 protein [Hymenobacter sp. ISL-91]MBT2558544.1 glycosyltransferase family 25 protein [Hymenobacter sp. ISL-91]
MRTFVISLQRSIERRKFIQQQLDKLSLPFEFFDAVDGRAMTEQYIEENTNIVLVRQEINFLNRGAIGCALSHYGIYKKMVEEGIEVALIMEDDVIISPSLKGILRRVKDTITTEDLIMLYFQSKNPVEITAQKAVDMSDGHKLQYMIKYGWVGAAGAYILTKSVAQRMMQIIHPIHTVADSWTTFKQERAFNYFRCVLPFPVRPAGLKSEIDYLKEGSLYARLANAIDKYKFPVLKQVLGAKRKRSLRKMQNYLLVDEDPFKTQIFSI